MRALAEPLFRRYMIGHTLSLLGLWVQRVALGWLTWELTHSGFWLGAIAFADLFPTLVVGPFAGVWADRMDRRQLVLWVQTLAAVLALVLFLMVLFDVAGIHSIFLVVLGLGVCASLAQPARLALVPQLVSRENLAAAVALGSVAFNVARFVGPMIAGGIIALTEVSYAFLFNSLSFAIMALAVATLPRGLNPIAEGKAPPVLKQIAAGFRYTLSHPMIAWLIFIMIAVAILAKPLPELLPGFADAVFNRGVVGLALMTQVMGFGSLLGGLLLTRSLAPRQLTRIAISAFLACGITQLVFGQTTHFYGGLAVLFFASMAITVTGIATQTLIQVVVREDMRGRVLSIWGLIFRGGAALSLPTLGALADKTSLAFAVTAAGFGCLLTSLLLLKGARQKIQEMRV